MNYIVKHPFNKNLNIDNNQLEQYFLVIEVSNINNSILHCIEKNSSEFDTSSEFFDYILEDSFFSSNSQSINHNNKKIIYETFMDDDFNNNHKIEVASIKSKILEIIDTNNINDINKSIKNLTMELHLFNTDELDITLSNNEKTKNPNKYYSTPKTI